MPQFSYSSKSKLETCHLELQRLMFEVVQWFDIRVTYGHRGQTDQHAAFLAGYSQKDWPDSLHNTVPSFAVDITPYPVDLENRDRHILMGGAVLAEARRLGIPIRWGGDWDGNFMFNERFQDLYHFELNWKAMNLDPGNYRPGPRTEP